MGRVAGFPNRLAVLTLTSQRAQNPFGPSSSAPRKKRRPSIGSIRFHPYEHPLLRELSRFDPETGDEATLH